MQPLISEVPFQSTGVYLVLLAQTHPSLRDLPERSKTVKAPGGARGPEMGSTSALPFDAHPRETLHFQGQLKGYRGRGGEARSGQQKESVKSGFSHWQGWETGGSYE